MGGQFPERVALGLSKEMLNDDCRILQSVLRQTDQICEGWVTAKPDGPFFQIPFLRPLTIGERRVLFGAMLQDHPIDPIPAIHAPPPPPASVEQFAE